MCGILQVQFAKMPTLRRLCGLLLIVFQIINCDIVNNPSSMEDSFKHCLISQPSSTLGYCLGVGAVNKLQSLESNAEFDLIDGFTLSKDGQQFREAYNFAERDPADFRTIVDSLTHVFGQRSMRWDMSFLYPGLAMRVAPSTTSPGILEFVLDPHREALNVHSLKEANTGRLLARQFLLPFLLGFKFNVTTILPILFGLLALIAKKAVILSKIALIISSAYGLGTLLLGSGNGNKYQQTYQSFNPGFGGHYNRYPEDEYHGEVLYRGMPSNTVDQLRLYGNLEKSFDGEDKSITKGRNFAWSEAEKQKKIV